MNRPEGETHTLHTLDYLDTLDFIMRGGLQGLAELQGQNDPDAKPCEPGANHNLPRGRAGLRGLFPMAAAAAKLLTGN